MSVKVTPFRRPSRIVKNENTDEQILFARMVEGFKSWAKLPSHQAIIDVYKVKIKYQCNPDTLPLSKVLQDFAFEVSGHRFHKEIITQKDNANLLMEFITTGVISNEREPRIARYTKGFCPKCGKYAKLQNDHVFPVSVFGDRYGTEGVQGLCEECNRDKSTKIDYFSVNNFATMVKF